MKINILYQKWDILFITTTLGIFQAMLNSTKPIILNKKKGRYVKLYKKFHKILFA